MLSKLMIVDQCCALNRIAKNKCNNFYFMAAELHVAYAPEYETVEDTRVKFEERRRIIHTKANRTFQQLYFIM